LQQGRDVITDDNEFDLGLLSYHINMLQRVQSAHHQQEDGIINCDILDVVALTFLIYTLIYTNKIVVKRVEVAIDMPAVLLDILSVGAV